MNKTLKKITAVLISVAMLVVALPMSALSYYETSYYHDYGEGEGYKEYYDYYVRGDVLKKFMIEFCRDSIWYFGNSHPSKEYLQFLPAEFYNARFPCVFWYGTDFGVSLYDPGDLENILAEVVGDFKYSFIVYEDIGYLDLNFYTGHHGEDKFNLVTTLTKFEQNPQIKEIFCSFPMDAGPGGFNVPFPENPIEDLSLKNLVQINKYVIGNAPVPADMTVLYDFNKDGKINAVDLIIAKRKFLAQFE